MERTPSIRIAIVLGVLFTTIFAYLGLRFGMVMTEAGATQVMDVEAIGSVADVYFDTLLARPVAFHWGSECEWFFAMLGFTVGFIIVGMGFTSVLGAKATGREHGSSRWASTKELRPFAEASNKPAKNGNRNVHIFTENVGLAWSRSKFEKDRDRNHNTFVIGGSGARKTRGYVEPNLLQGDTDFIVSDPKNGTLPDVGWFLEADGYDISVLNTLNPSESCRYNPFLYLKDEGDYQKFADTLADVTQDPTKSGGDQFWSDSFRLLLTSLVAFICTWLPPEERGMLSLFTLLDLFDVKEEDSSFKSDLDLLFEEVRLGWREEPCDSSTTVHGYSKTGATKRVPSKLVRYTDGRPRASILKPYRTADGKTDYTTEMSTFDDYALMTYSQATSGTSKTKASQEVTAFASLRAFGNPQIMELMSGEDEMHLERLGNGKGKHAVFCVFDDANSTYGLIHGLLIRQAIEVMFHAAERQPKKELPRQVHLYLDEYRTLNLPKDMQGVISTVRSRGVSMSPILQSMAQLQGMYGKEGAQQIMDNCDTVLFLGGQSRETTELISKMAGSQTIHSESSTTNHSTSGGWSKQTSTMGRELIKPEEVGRMDPDKAIVIIKGAHPCMDKKADKKRHANWRWCKKREPFDEAAMRCRESDRRACVNALIGCRPTALVSPSVAQRTLGPEHLDGFVGAWYLEKKEQEAA